MTTKTTKKAVAKKSPASEQEAKQAPAAEKSQISRPVKPARSAVVPLADIVPCRFQNRKEFDAEKLKELAASIVTNGLMNPVTLWEPKGKGKGFELVAGERRWRAAKLAGLKSIPATIVDTDERGAAEMCVTENIQRADLSTMEQAEGVATLRKVGLTLEECASRLGVSRQWIFRRDRISALPEVYKKKLANEWSGLALESVEILAAAAAHCHSAGEQPLKAIVETIDNSLSCWDKFPTADDFRGEVSREMHALEGQGFDTSKCKNCPSRIPADDAICEILKIKANGLGCCTSEVCYNRLSADWLKGQVQKIKDKFPGAVIVEAEGESYIDGGRAAGIGLRCDLQNRYDVADAKTAGAKLCIGVKKRGAELLVGDKTWWISRSAKTRAERLSDDVEFGRATCREGVVQKFQAEMNAYFGAMLEADTEETEGKIFALAMILGVSPQDRIIVNPDGYDYDYESGFGERMIAFADSGKNFFSMAHDDPRFRSLVYEMRDRVHDALNMTAVNHNANRCYAFAQMLSQAIGKRLNSSDSNDPAQDAADAFALQANKKISASGYDYSVLNLFHFQNLRVIVTLRRHAGDDPRAYWRMITPQYVTQGEVTFSVDEGADEVAKLADELLKPLLKAVTEHCQVFQGGSREVLIYLDEKKFPEVVKKAMENWEADKADANKAMKGAD